ncbi:unnamed protein product [Absidia cylindrospora]
MQQHDDQSPLEIISNTTPLQNETDERKKTDTDDTRQQVEEQLQDLLQVFFNLAVMVYDFQPDGNKLVWDKIRTATENQFTNGKIQAVDSFRSLLSDEFAKSFPDLYENNNDLDSPYIDQQQEDKQAQGQQESSSTSTSI